MLYRLSATALSVLLLGACSAEPTQPEFDGSRGTILAEAIPPIVVDGLPGQQPFATGFIDELGSRCQAAYANPTAGNAAVSNRFAPAERIHIVANKKRIKATCKFTDDSGVYEDNAETGKLASCDLRLADGRIYLGGTGHLTSAANIVNEVDGLPFGSGGNTTLHCTFEL